MSFSPALRCPRLPALNILTNTMGSMMSAGCLPGGVALSICPDLHQNNLRDGQTLRECRASRGMVVFRLWGKYEQWPLSPPNVEGCAWSRPGLERFHVLPVDFRCSSSVGNRSMVTNGTSVRNRPILSAPRSSDREKSPVKPTCSPTGGFASRREECTEVPLLVEFFSANRVRSFALIANSPVSSSDGFA